MGDFLWDSERDALIDGYYKYLLRLRETLEEKAGGRRITTLVEDYKGNLVAYVENEDGKKSRIELGKFSGVCNLLDMLYLGPPGAK